jgi:hypothetical protein
VLKERVEGMGLNAAVRTSGYSKNTILNWEKRLAALKDYKIVQKLIGTCGMWVTII